MFQGFKKATTYGGARKLRLTLPPVRRVLNMLNIWKLCVLFQWQELIARKPKEGEEDPVLVEEIRKARENVGMYTRKTSLEYEETDPIRFETHKSQLVTLLTQVSILNIRKLVFNHNSEMWKFRSDEVDSTTKLNKKFYMSDKP